MMMLLLWMILSIPMASVVHASIYLYDSEDSTSVEVYDCLYHEPMPYCRRPSQPITLQRDNGTHLCHHGGVSHSFFSLWQKNVSVNEVLHGWRSSLDKADDYGHYLVHRNSSHATTTGEFLCQCIDSASFGRHCQYRLPIDTTFDETVSAKFHDQTKRLMYEGDIVCYTTLKCDFGLLCLDWRDICDGNQQCMSGTDEENCDKLEFNECEADEYRCENGMCIADEYFLDGDYDCMDWSDERESFNDAQCPVTPASMECDDRICSKWQWPCGDGQCIRLYYRFPIRSECPFCCMNRREQFFWCESDVKETLWTLPNGRCSAHEIFDAQNITDYCHYLRICMLAANTTKDCSCNRNGRNCSELFRNRCSSRNVVHYPAGALIAPYIVGYYDDTFLSPEQRLWKLNGTIKCRGFQIHFSMMVQNRYFSDLLDLENYACGFAANGSAISAGGYDPYCHNDSRTFSNRSYNIHHSCLNSQMCPSVYRIQNEWALCSNETHPRYSNETIEKSCSNSRRHRFRCSPEETTCYYARILGDSYSWCENEHDEYSMSTNVSLTRLKCNKDSKADCQFFRRHIEASWNDSIRDYSYSANPLANTTPFRWYCDTFPDTLSQEDEDSANCQSSWLCLQGQWQCHSGHCIELSWVLDGVWDCPDGSEEENIFIFDYHPSKHDYSSINISSLTEKHNNYYPPALVWSLCNVTMGFPCYPSNVSHSDRRTKHCINTSSADILKVDCLQECDEKTVIDHCYRSLVALGYHLQCISMRTCSSYSYLFENIHTNSSVQQQRSATCNESYSCSPFNNFTCWDGNTVTRRCNGDQECSHGEDEYMCPTQASSVNYPLDKKRQLRTKTKQLQLHPYPPTTRIANISLPDLLMNYSRLPPKTTNTLMNSSIFNQCNRGIPIHHYNGSLICFCPPQYHGDQCQYHTDRIALRLRVDFNYSSYTINSDATIVNKYLLLFLYNDEVISTDEFHLRPSTDILKYPKKLIYLHYPHANDSIVQKQKRYFNRSNINQHHPYSIRIEAFEMKTKVKPRRFAAWRYLIYFDFLPVHRLAKVLRFIDPNENRSDPCREQPCGVNEECYQLQNEPSRHLCLCKSNFSGPTCSVSSVVCAQKYCSSNALCQPGYRSVIDGKEWPYCICPLHHIGQRCELTHGGCWTNLCSNNGTCHQGSQPHRYRCECTDEYTGDTCTEPKRSAHFSLEKNTSSEYAGVVIQDFAIDFVTLELRLLHQSISRTLPQRIQYLQSARETPAIILLKLCLLESTTFHILSVQINQTSARADTSINENNHCKHASDLLTQNESESINFFSSSRPLSILIGQVPFIYHSLCLNDSSRLCFYDAVYLCICNDHQLGVECFIYDHALDSCDKCLFGGRCLKGETNEFLCICPPCHTGNHCQFNFGFFSFTLDQLFYNDLLSKDTMIRHLTFYSLILGPCLLFFICLINNLCCFVTFRRPKCLRNGIGQYLLSMTAFNQMNLACLVIRFTHLTINIASPYSFHQFDMIFCKLSNYFLVTSTRLTQLLSSLIAIERLYVVVFLNGNWLKKPHIARRIIFVTTLIILIISAYELVFIDLQKSSDDGINAICVLSFPRDSRVWNDVHFTVMVITSLTPFVINLVCTIGIICIVTKKKMNASMQDICKWDRIYWWWRLLWWLTYIYSFSSTHSCDSCFQGCRDRWRRTINR